MQPVSEPDIFMSLLPFATLTLIVFAFMVPISRRKGKSFAYTLLILIPVVGWFITWYVISLTDKSVLDRLAALEGKVR
ncbi:hypothetical protein [Pseudolabrys sp. FHR47]|uniref:hypothetical protein n=1 Tax=Pseudolabrys sp. FHR47 TaxID=2562284 RepID=UPI0010BE9869|nr:hypothetical protein [Pseudolabrys sp. FHR47]